MPYERPTLSELITATKGDLISRLPSLDPTIPNSFSANLAEVIAGGISGLYGYLSWMSEQMFVDTADAEYLDRMASNYGLSRFPALYADGECTFTGAIGSSVAQGDLVTGASGIKYAVDTGFVLASASEVHTVTATTSGVDANLLSGAELSFVSTPSGMDNLVIAGSGITGGTDRESDDELRARIKAKLASPPKGGKPDDYISWAKEATDATRAWCIDINNMADHKENVPLGCVLVYFVMDDTYPDGLPLPADVLDVQEFIAPLVPAGKIFDSSVVASSGAKLLTAEPVNFEIQILPNTPTNQTAVEASIKSEITYNRVAGGEINLSVFYDAMSSTPNLTSWTINTIDGLAPATVSAPAGSVHTMGSVTFV